MAGLAVGAAVAASMGRILGFQAVARLERLIGPVFQGRHDGGPALHGMKDIAATGDRGQRQSVPRTQAVAEMGRA